MNGYRVRVCGEIHEFIGVKSREQGTSPEAFIERLLAEAFPVEFARGANSIEAQVRVCAPA